MKSIAKTWSVNGKSTTVAVPPAARLLDVLRDDLHLTGAKEGCSEGECGACTVLVDDKPVASCLVLAAQLPDRTRILTIEGVGKKRLGRLLQEAFVEVGAVQCGFCIPGMILAAYALLLQNPRPAEREIRRALAGNLCRCTGYAKIVAAVRLAAKRMEAQS